ncbi:MAG: sugar phosphate isomerase/epimerase [Acidobacteriota bacterium]
MDTNEKNYSRRAFGKIALAGVPASWVLANLPVSAWAKINSKINGVQIGAITYSFRTMPDPNDIIKAYVSMGLGEMELMSGDAEKLAGAPIPAGRGGGAGRGPGAPGAPPTAAPGGPAPGEGGQGGRRGGTPPTPEQVAAREAAAKALRDWRMAATEATFKPVKQKIADAGIDLRLLTYNLNVRTTQDDEIEYAFKMAKWLGVKGITTSTQVSMAKRLAPFADKYKMPVGFHGHANLTDPDEVAKPESFEAVMAQSKYLMANMDIGHYTEAGFDPIAFIEKHHDRITNLHLKDKKKGTNGGGNTPWGQGDTPIKETLKLLQKNKWDIPANIEFEYAGDPMVEIPKCLQYIKEALA